MELSGRPIISTSANNHGRPLPIFYQRGKIKSQKLFRLYRFFIDCGVLDKNPPSTIVDLVTGKVSRVGKVTEKQILDLLGVNFDYKERC